MTEKIKALFIKYREIIMYIIFGVLTTAVNLVSYYALLYLGSHYLAAQIVSWVLAVAFAFATNKLFVFENKTESARGLFYQISGFVLVRLGSGVLETGFLWLSVDVAHISEHIAKIPVAVLTVILNYIASKLFIFKKRNK